MTELAKAVELVFYYTLLAARFNIAPSQSAPVIVRENGQTAMRPLRWGLIPHWTKAAPAGNPLINARRETLRIKPSFSQALEQRRCLIPADGFYEWKEGADGKQPFRVRLKSGEPFCFAGLWERWVKPPSLKPSPDRAEDSPNQTVETFTIITRPADQTMAPLHSRMPLMVPPAHYRLWLENQPRRESFQTVLNEPLTAPLKIYPVSQFVNRTAIDDARCVEPVEIERDMFEKPWWG